MNPLRILVAFDTYTASRSALNFAVAFASRMKDRGAVVNVIHVRPTAENPQTDKKLEDSARANCAKYMELAQAAYPGTTCNLEIMTGKPMDVIRKSAQHNDVLFMGTHGRAVDLDANELKFGSVAENLLQGSSIPVVVLRVTGKESEVPEGYSFDNFVVPYDGAKASQKLVEKIPLLIQLANTKHLTFVTSIPPQEGTPGTAKTEAEKHLQNAIDTVAASLPERMPQGSPKLEKVILESSNAPAQAIAEYVKQRNEQGDPCGGIALATRVRPERETVAGTTTVGVLHQRLDRTPVVILGHVTGGKHD